jgi:two-component system OmpR family sensor kinase
MYSLRRTLSVRFSATLFAALLLIAAWAFLGARRLMLEQLDRDLAAGAQLESSYLRAGFPLHPHPDLFTWDEFVDEVNRFVVARDSVGTIVAANTGLAADLPLDTAAFTQAASGADVWTTQPWLGERIRALYVPVAVRGPQGRLVVQVAASYERLDRSRNDLLLLMLGTVLLGTLATSLGARWLADSSVEPVLAITAQAEAVEPEHPGQRISAHADVTELAGLVAVINRMIARLESALDSQRRMIADAGHDLRTPITAMQGEIEVALRHPRSPETYQAVLESLLEEVAHLAALSDSLILLARLDAKDLRPAMEETDVRALVERSVQRALGRGPSHRFALTPGPAILAQVDPHMIGLVCDHLLDNAIKHTPDGTAVTVALDGDARRWSMTVMDTGPGLPDELLSVLFERFVRGDSARTRGGAGLGLSVSAAIVNAHGGTISAQRSAPGGLAISIAVPFRPPTTA